MRPSGQLPFLGTSAVRTAHRDVTDRLREAIVSGALPAGTRLVQAELAASLSVSVTPIREALRELEGLGLVDFDPFRGAAVHEVSLEELDEIYELRAVLVPIAIRERVRTITDAELDEAEAIVSQMTLKISDARWVEANRRLHQLLDGVPQRPHLRMILDRLAAVSALYVGISVDRDPQRRRRARRDHEALIRAYRARDAETVIELTLRHLSDTAEVVRAALRDAQGAKAEADSARAGAAEAAGQDRPAGTPRAPRAARGGSARGGSAKAATARAGAVGAGAGGGPGGGP